MVWQTQRTCVIVKCAMKKRKYTDEQLIETIKKCFSFRQVLIELGLNPKGGGNYQVIHNKIKELNIDISHFSGKLWSKGKILGPKINIQDYLNNLKPIQSFKLKNKLIREGLLIPKCSSCELSNWLDKPIPLELDHINGQHYDNSLSNLRLICPNCHALTDNYRGKNKGKTKYFL